MFTLKQSFKEYIKQKNTIRHLYRITVKLLEYTYVSSYVGYTYIILFTCIIIPIQEKKTNHLYNPGIISTSIVTFGSVNMSTYNPTLPVITAKKHSSTAQKSLVQALLVGVFL